MQFIKILKNNIWIGGIEKDLMVISSDNKITTYPIQQIKSISETMSSEILVSGRQGVFKINHPLETFGLIEDLIPDKNSLAFSTINTVYESNTKALLSRYSFIFLNSRLLLLISSIFYISNACLKSSMISSTCSNPTETLTKPPVIPVCKRSSSDNLACVVDAG